MSQPRLTDRKIQESNQPGLFSKEDEIKLYVKEIQRVKRLYRNDPESAHSRAEEIVCELLTKLGYGKVASAFDKVPRY